MNIIIIKGNGLSGALKYAAGEDGSRGTGVVVRLGGTMVGRSVRELSAEFRLTRELAPRVTQACRHLVVAFAEEDRRLTTDELWAITRQLVRGLGYHESPWMSYLHRDGHTQHIHIVTTQIRHDGGRVKEWHDRERAQRLAQKLEAAHDLVLAPRVARDDPRHPKLGTYGLGYCLDGAPKLPPAGRVVLRHVTPQEAQHIPPGRLAQGIQPTTPSLRAGELGQRELIRLAMGTLLPRVSTLCELRYGLQAFGIGLVADLERNRLKFLVGKGAIFGSAVGVTLRGLEERGLRLEPLPPRLTARERGALAAPELPPLGHFGLQLGDGLVAQLLRLRHQLVGVAAKAAHASAQRAASVPGEHQVATYPPLPPPGRLEPSADDLLPSPGRLGFQLGSVSGPSADDQLPSPGRLGFQLGPVSGPTPDDQLPSPGRLRLGRRR